MKSKLNSLLAAVSLLAGIAHPSPARAATIEVTGPITGEVTWTAGNTYLLTNYVYVLSNAVLRIEPGTVIKGRNGSAPNFGTLFVCQGGKILAEGRPHSPIIFTAEEDDVNDPEDLLVTDRQLWGGLVILGNARINKAVNAAGDAATPKYEVYEGLEDLQINGQYVHRYGGDNDEDSSGVLRYVSLRHGGQKLSPDKEINGLSLGGVGRGTVVEYVEALSFADDGFEFFGGSVNTKYLVSAFNDDDAFDTDMGWNGKNQFWFAIQSNDRRDNGSEQNGEPNERSDGTGVPAATYEIYNATLIGAGAQAGGTANNHGMLLRRYVQAGWYNSIFTDFNGQPLNGGGPQTGSAPKIMDNLWWGFASPVYTNELFAEVANGNATNVNPELRGIGREANGGLDPRPMEGSPALTTTRTPPADGFYQAAGFKGAFGTGNWASDWTALGELGILTAAGGVNPLGEALSSTPASLYDLIANDPSFSHLAAAIDRAGLASALRGPGPLTLFAPGDAAFEALGAHRLDALMANVPSLTTVLTYHGLAGTYPAAALTSTNYTTLSGDPLAVTVDGATVRVNDARVIQADRMATNGVLHSIDRLLVPPASAPIQLTLLGGAQGLGIAWSGGQGPFTVQKAVDPAGPWTDVTTTPAREYAIPGLEEAAAFYRVASRARLGVGLRGAYEVPSVATAGVGSGTGILDGNRLSLNLSYEGLSGTVTMAHIHGPAAVTENATVMTGLVPGLGNPGSTAGTISGTLNLDSRVAEAIVRGATYLNIHTTTSAMGEIRGQLFVVP